MTIVFGTANKNKHCRDVPLFFLDDVHPGNSLVSFGEVQEEEKSSSVTQSITTH